MKKLVLVIAALLFGAFLTPLYAASSDSGFYNGKIITYIVATKPGGGYDTYARLIGKYMQKYIPGSTVIVKNSPGAGHIIGANETYLARPNGLTMGTFNTGLIYSQIVKQPGIKFDLTKFSWVGKASSDLRVLIVGKNTPYKTVQDLIDSKEPIKMAASGMGSSAYTETILIGAALGANMKAIPGYSGNEGNMAMLRGEVAGTNGAYTGLYSFIKTGETRVILQIGAKKHPDLPDVPLASELKLTPRGKALFNLIVGVNELGRLTGSPPKTPAARLQVLREAYRSALEDQELRKEAEKMGLDLDPAYGEEAAKMMDEAIHQPEENITLLRSLVKIE